jgi:hypothetical protein
MCPAVSGGVRRLPVESSPASCRIRDGYPRNLFCAKDGGPHDDAFSTGSGSESLRSGRTLRAGNDCSPRSVQVSPLGTSRPHAMTTRFTLLGRSPAPCAGAFSAFGIRRARPANGLSGLGKRRSGREAGSPNGEPGRPQQSRHSIRGGRDGVRAVGRQAPGGVPRPDRRERAPAARSIRRTYEEPGLLPARNATRPPRRPGSRPDPRTVPERPRLAPPGTRAVRRAGERSQRGIWRVRACPPTPLTRAYLHSRQETIAANRRNGRRSAGRQVGRSAGRQVGRSAGRQVGRSAGRQIVRSPGPHVGRSDGAEGRVSGPGARRARGSVPDRRFLRRVSQERNEPGVGSCLRDEDMGQAAPAFCLPGMPETLYHRGRR